MNKVQKQTLMHESVFPPQPPTPTYKAKLCTAGSHLLTSDILLSYKPHQADRETT